MVVEQKEQTTTAPEQQTPKGSRPKKPLIVCCYHDADIEFVQAFEPQLKFLWKQFEGLDLHFFGFADPVPTGPTGDRGSSLFPDVWDKQLQTAKDYQATYAFTINHALERAALFLPCLSPAFLMRLLQETQDNPKLSTQLASLSCPIFPIAIHPTAHVQAGTRKVSPLVAYTKGYEREQACADLAAAIEPLLRRHWKGEKKQIPALLEGKKRRLF